MRQIFPLSWAARSLPPTATQLVEMTSPFLDMAMLDVPPPISQERMVFLRARDLAVAPEPRAVIRLSKFAPAVAATNFPESVERASTISLAFCFLAISR